MPEGEPVEEHTQLVTELCEKYKAYENALNMLIDALKKGRRLDGKREQGSGVFGFMSKAKKLSKFGTEAGNILDFCGKEDFKNLTTGIPDLVKNLQSAYEGLKRVLKTDNLADAVEFEQKSKTKCLDLIRLMNLIPKEEQLKKAADSWLKKDSHSDESKAVVREVVSNLSRALENQGPEVVNDGGGNGGGDEAAVAPEGDGGGGSGGGDEAAVAPEGDGSDGNKLELGGTRRRAPTHHRRRHPRKTPTRKTTRTPTRRRHPRKTAPRTRRR